MWGPGIIFGKVVMPKPDLIVETSWRNCIILKNTYRCKFDRFSLCDYVIWYLLTFKHYIWTGNLWACIQNMNKTDFPYSNWCLLFSNIAPTPLHIQLNFVRTLSENDKTTYVYYSWKNNNIIAVIILLGIVQRSAVSF